MFKLSKSRYNPRLIWTVYTPCCNSYTIPEDCCTEVKFHNLPLPGDGVLGPVSFPDQRDVFGGFNEAARGKGGGGYGGR